MFTKLGKRLGAIPDGYAMVLPFVAYLLGTAFIGRFDDEHYPLAYGLVAVLVSLIILALTWGRSLFKIHRNVGWGVIFGVVGIAMWIGFCHLNLESRLAPYLPSFIRPGPRVGYNPFEELGTGVSAWMFIAVRLWGIAALVPIAEELFWRGFLLRWFIDEDWKKVRLGEYTLHSCAMVTLMFTLAHPEWLAAATYCLLINSLLYWKKDLWLCVVAHATSNFVLAMYVLADWFLGIVVNEPTSVRENNMRLKAGYGRVDVRLMIYLLGLCSVAFNLVQADENQSDSHTNLIYIMVDDLGYGDLGCFGQERIKTPNLDRMATEGMKLTSYYASCTVCRPSRLGLWTGQHMGHTPIDSNAKYIFRPEDVTVAELLKSAGYVTGGVGKWAMGGPDTDGNPNQNGFDFWMGYLDQSEAHNYYPTHLYRNNQKYPLPGNVIGDYENGRGRVSSERVTYSHDVMTDQMLGFVREHAESPFLLHVHWTIPHANNEGGRVLGDGMEVPDYGIYDQQDWPNVEKGQAAMISRMDKDVGRLFELLKELEIDAQTLVVFTSDNGPHSEGGHKHEYFDANGPLRGYKRDLYEGGIRVPTIARWPGRIAPNSSSDAPFAGYDWLATACEVAKMSAPEGTDGVSFLPTLLGKTQEQHEFLFWSYGDKKAIRMGNWKAVIPGKDRMLELYDLEQDIGESTDIARKHPDIVELLSRKIEMAQQ